MAATPLQISSNSVLSTDYLASNQVLADATSATPVSVFRNPFKNGAVEALVITSAQGTESQICYLNQNAGVTTGWQLTGLTSNWGAITATEVVAFATTWNTVEAYFIGLDGNLYHLVMETGGATWGEPQAMEEAPSGMSHLGVTYQPGTTTISQTTTLVTAMTADARLFQGLSSDGNWSLSETDPVFPSGIDSLTVVTLAARWSFGGPGSESWYFYVLNGWLYAGTISDSTAATLGQLVEVDGGTALGMALPTDDTSPYPVIFLGTATGITWVTMSQDHEAHWSFPTDQLTLPTAVRGGAVVQFTNGLANIYCVDTNDNMWVVPVTSWNSQPSGLGLTYNTPVFGQPIQLHAGIGTIHADMMPTDTPTLIGVDTALGALHLNYKDPSVGNWRTGAMVLPSTEQYSVTRWRTEIAVYDAQGQPVPNYQLTVAADSAVDIAVGGQFSYVDSATTTTITTNALGKATLATLATGLTTAKLTVSATDLPQAVTITPHQGISDYMAGTGTLPGLPALSGDTLQQATVNGQPLAPALSGADVTPAKVAGYMKELAQAPGNTSATLQAKAQAGGARYLVLTKLDPGGPMYQEHATAEEMEALHARVRAALGSSLWDDVWDWAGDVWEGIKHAAISVYHAAVDTANQALKLFVKIGEDIFELAEWSVKTIEDALHGIEAIFNWIGAEVDKVVDWLKAIFDFSAIWNTKTALESGIAGYLTCMGNGIDAFSNYFAGTTSPIASLKATIDQQFDSAIQQFSGKAFSSLSGWQAPGQPPSQAAGPNGTPSAATYSNNVHANWFHDQVTTNAPTTIDGTSGLQDQTEWNNLVTALKNVTDDLETAFDDFANAFSALFTVHDPSTLGDILIADFLSAIKALVDAVLDAADALIQAFLLLAKTVVGALDDLLTTEISIGFLNTLYGWIASWAGVSNPPALTPAGLFSLLIAFPTTVIFKLAVGVDKEPFPGGQLPTPGSTHATIGAGAGVDESPTVAWLAWSSSLVGAIVTSVNFLPAILDDVAGDELTWASTWKTVGGIVAVVASMAPTVLPEAYDWTGALSSGGAELVAAVGAALIMAALLLSGLLASAWRWIRSDQAKDPIRIISTIFGVGMLGYQIYCVVEDYDQLSDAQIAVDLMSPWGNIMSVAGTSWVKDSELYPFAVVFQVAGDLLSTLGSGVAGIEGLLSNEPSLA